MSYLEDSYSALKRFEGSIPYMYLDTVGLVTVGIGFMLASSYAAATLPFTHPDGSVATQLEISDEYSRVKALPKGKLPDFYHSLSSLLLPDAQIYGMLATKVDTFEQGLLRIYPHYDTYPDSAKIALIDMAYNLGIAKLSSTYPRFNSAVRAHDWQLAASQCHRNGPSEERNLWTKNQFLEASL